MRLLIKIGVIVLLLPLKTWAFPEMVKKDYVNCISCHQSPTGGGVLTSYGRELSRELMSHWSGEHESDFAYGLVKTPESLSLGGDFRVIQTYINNTKMIKADYFIMQTDLEAALSVSRWTGVATLGTAKGGGFISRRHYLLYRPKDELSIRVGRFFPAYGINTADHVIPIKRGIGFDEYLESYNVETSWIGESLNVYLTGIFGRLDQPTLSREKGAAVSVSYFVGEQHKLGASYYLGEVKQIPRHLAGPYGIFGLSHNVVLLSELDFQFSNPSTPTAQTGAVWYQRLDYEFSQGVHAYLVQSFSKLNFHDEKSLSDSYGIGIQFFPRPHFEIQMEWQKLRVLTSAKSFTDFAWLLVHFYP